MSNLLCIGIVVLYSSSVGCGLTPPIAVVTGGNRGLGLAIVRQLIEDSDANVVLAARNLTSANAAAGEVGSSRLFVEPLDVASRESIDDFSARVLSRFGPPTLLVNNAAICVTDCECKSDRDILSETLAINFEAPKRLMKQLKFTEGCDLETPRCVINVSSGDGELKWLNSKIAGALESCNSPDDVQSVADSINVKGGLLDQLIVKGGELAFGSSPSY